MNEHDKNLMKEWVRIWKSTGEKLEEIRREDIRNSDTMLAIEACGDCLESARFHSLLHRPSSGLVEQQKYFMKARK